MDVLGERQNVNSCERGPLICCRLSDVIIRDSLGGDRGVALKQNWRVKLKLWTSSRSICYHTSPVFRIWPSDLQNWSSGSVPQCFANS